MSLLGNTTAQNTPNFLIMHGTADGRYNLLVFVQRVQESLLFVCVPSLAGLSFCDVTEGVDKVFRGKSCHLVVNLGTPTKRPESYLNKWVQHGCCTHLNKIRVNKKNTLMEVKVLIQLLYSN